jgi:hypothetical protein
MEMIIGYGVSYFVLRYFDRIPSKDPILKSVTVSFIALIIAIILIDVPQSFSGIRNSSDALYYFLFGVMFNVTRILLLGIGIGYLYDERMYSCSKETKNEFNQKDRRNWWSSVYFGDGYRHTHSCFNTTCSWLFRFSCQRFASH